MADLQNHPEESERHEQEGNQFVRQPRQRQDGDGKHDSQRREEGDHAARASVRQHPEEDRKETEDRSLPFFSLEFGVDAAQGHQEGAHGSHEEIEEDVEDHQADAVTGRHLWIGEVQVIDDSIQEKEKQQENESLNPVFGERQLGEGQIQHCGSPYRFSITWRKLSTG